MPFWCIGMAFVYIFIFTYGFLDWAPWLGLSLSAAEEFLFGLFAVTYLIFLQLSANRLKVRLISGGALGLFWIYVAVFLGESAYVYLMKTSGVVVSYCVLNILLVFAYYQKSAVVDCRRWLSCLYFFLSFIQIIVLLLALIDFDNISAMSFAKTSGIERKMELYGVDSMYSYRNIGPYYFSSVTDSPLFGDFGILGFCREPHISFTLMLVLFSIVIQSVGGFHKRLFVFLLFLPSSLYISSSNIVAMFVGGALYILLGMYSKSTAFRRAGIFLFSVVLAFVFAFGDSVVDLALSNAVGDRSIMESALNLLRLFNPSVLGSGLADIYDRNTQEPQPIGLMALILYAAFILFVIGSIQKLLKFGVSGNALILCYLVAYSLKCATVFAFLPIFAGVVLISLPGRVSGDLIGKLQ